MKGEDSPLLALDESWLGEPGVLIHQSVVDGVAHLAQSMTHDCLRRMSDPVVLTECVLDLFGRQVHDPVGTPVTGSGVPQIPSRPTVAGLMDGCLERCLPRTGDWDEHPAARRVT